ncbi:MAG: hypothetical protein ACKOWI_04295 [Rhodoluna sp.]
MPELFLDESKAKNYVFIGILVAEVEAPRVRKRVAALKLPRQRSVHFVKESDSRRRKLLQDFKSIGFTAVKFECEEKNQKLAREKCVKAVASFAIREGISRLVFELDESSLSNDEKWLKEAIQTSRAELGFRHQARNEEPLLWVADAVAWCDARGGDWKQRISSLILDSYKVDC